MPMTTEQIRLRGLSALRKELGLAGLVRFLRHFDSGTGNYTRDREETLAGLSMEEIRAQTNEHRPAKRPRGRADRR